MKIAGLLLLLLLAPEGETLKIAPWNGYKGAVSFTFDDGDPSHLTVAIPELDKHKIRGTFFLIVKSMGAVGPWKQALATGHEIASHTATHTNPAQFKPDQEEAEIAGAAKTLEQAFGHPMVSFAYPFSAITPSLKAKIEKTHLLARGGAGPVIPPDPEPDWLNLVSQVTLTDTKVEVYKGWIDEAWIKGAWSIFMIHGLEGTTWGYSPIKKADFAATLDHVKDKDLWVAPFGEVGAYFRAQKLVEQSKGVAAPGGMKWEWKVPPLFPKGVVLKVKIDPAKQELRQKDLPIKPDAKGLGAVRFDEGSLVLRPR
ncbi:MAG TPA: polysaccharide deacetylase family protein [Planctomycetota bacterium]|nr:polysaccharide deacetylase family protein [Planctomycetota bacterium]